MLSPEKFFFFSSQKKKHMILHGLVLTTHWSDCIFKNTIGFISSYPLQWYIKHNGSKLFGIVSEQFKNRVCACGFFFFSVINKRISFLESRSSHFFQRAQTILPPFFIIMELYQPLIFLLFIDDPHYQKKPLQQ